MTRIDTPAYRKAYKRGWKYSHTSTANLDTADARGWTRDDAWLDGYLDAAASRDYMHMLTCTDNTFHITCGG
jgi:hypothetical protein